MAISEGTTPKRKTDYTLKEAGEALGRHWKTVRSWVIDGKIKAIKIGRQWVIKASEIRRIRREGVCVEHENKSNNN